MLLISWRVTLGVSQCQQRAIVVFLWENACQAEAHQALDTAIGCSQPPVRWAWSYLIHGWWPFPYSQPRDANSIKQLSWEPSVRQLESPQHHWDGEAGRQQSVIVSIIIVALLSRCLHVILFHLRFRPSVSSLLVTWIVDRVSFRENPNQSLHFFLCSRFWANYPHYFQNYVAASRDYGQSERNCHRIGLSVTAYWVGIHCEHFPRKNLLSYNSE